MCTGMYVCLFLKGFMMNVYVFVCLLYVYVFLKGYTNVYTCVSYVYVFVCERIYECIRVCDDY